MLEYYVIAAIFIGGLIFAVWLAAVWLAATSIWCCAKHGRTWTRRGLGAIVSVHCPICHKSWDEYR